MYEVIFDPDAFEFLKKAEKKLLKEFGINNVNKIKSISLIGNQKDVFHTEIFIYHLIPIIY